MRRTAMPRYRHFERNQHLIRPGWHGSARWTAGPSQLTWMWTTGYHGVRVHLLPLGHVLLGRVEAFTDFEGLPEPRALVLAMPSPCTAVPVESARM